MNLKRNIIVLMLGAAVGGAGLQGEDLQYLGGQVGTGMPVGSFGSWTSKRPTYTLGIQQLLSQGDGTLLRTRLDVYGTRGHQEQTVSGPEGPVTGALDNRFTVVSLGLESLYWFQGDIKSGPYVFGGAGGASTRLVSTSDAHPTGGPDLWPGGGSLTTTSNKVFWSLGLGWQYNRNYGAEVRYVATRWSYDTIATRVSYVTAGFTLRFP